MVNCTLKGLRRNKANSRRCRGGRRLRGRRRGQMRQTNPIPRLRIADWIQRDCRGAGQPSPGPVVQTNPISGGRATPLFHYSISPPSQQMAIVPNKANFRPSGGPRGLEQTIANGARQSATVCRLYPTGPATGQSGQTEGPKVDAGKASTGWQRQGLRPWRWSFHGESAIAKLRGLRLTLPPDQTLRLCVCPGRTIPLPGLLSRSRLRLEYRLGPDRTRPPEGGTPNARRR